MNKHRKEPENERAAVPAVPRQERGVVVRREGGRMLTAREFQDLGAVPPEVEWFANIDNPRTRPRTRSTSTSSCRLSGSGSPRSFGA